MSSTIGFNGYYMKKYIRSAVARCIRDAKTEMKKNYGSGKDSARLAGAENALCEFAANLYENLYRVSKDTISEDRDAFFKECGLLVD